MPRALAVIVVVSVLSLLVGLVVALRGGGSTWSREADSYSRSAIGHRGLANLLDELEIPVQRARVVPGELLPRDLVAVICEPRPDADPDSTRASGRWQAYSALAYRLLVVLPRWEASAAHPEKIHWIGGRAELPTSTVDAVAEVLELPGEVTRPQAVPTGWDLPADLPPPTLERPQLLRAADAGNGRLVPLWSCDQGMLLARWERQYAEETVLVLSDPDLINNLGLGRGANARLALAALALAGAPPGPVLIDETLHGHALPRSPGAALLRPPLLWLLLHLILLALAALWSANQRFGRPAPAARAGRDGKAFLVASTASLLLVGGHRGHLLRRYLEHAVRGAARARHVSATGPPGEVARRLDRLPAAHRAPAMAAATLCDRMLARADQPLDAAGLLAAAREIHAWTREMHHGTRRPARDHRPAA